MSLVPRLSFSLGDEAMQGIWSLALVLGFFVLVFSFMGKAGELGGHINSGVALLLGVGKWALPVILGLTLVSLSADRRKRFDSANIFGLFLFIISLPAFLYFFDLEASGGLVGMYSAEWLISFFGPVVTSLVFISGFIISLLLVLDTSLSRLLGEESEVYGIFEGVTKLALRPFATGLPRSLALSRNDIDEEEEEEHESDVKEYEVDEEEDAREEKEDGAKTSGSSRRSAPQDDNIKETRLPRRSFSLASRNDRWERSGVEIRYPIELLKSRPKKPISGNIKRNQDIIRQTLLDFGISISMGQVKVGPSVTQYSFKPAKGIPVSRVKSLTDDLAMNLSVPSLRLEAPIPGKPWVGLEIPNKTKVMVTLKELIRSKEFKERKASTMLTLGRDVNGRIWMDDLTKLPHLLIAGATNSGKSVCLHSIITSLLYQNSPDDLKLILIDVKRVELMKYNDLPYLIAPVVTDDKRALRALKWCVLEMEKRLDTLSSSGCENIQEYRKKKKDMPYLVIVVDELGDLLGTARRETESAIIRLGQKARAAGIHLVLATQRPSVDVVSPLIKANMPGRISFRVTSGGNSMTILDHYGAEKLLGQGDMLYVNSGMSKPIRLQGAFIDKTEVNAVVKHAKRVAGKAKYSEDVIELNQRQLDLDSVDEVDDSLLEEAKDMIFKYKKASASMLQSRLSIGYPRANRILDILEREGVVGPSVQNKPREVYLDT